MKVSLSFFGTGRSTLSPGERYATVLELATMADDLGLHAIWIPERHFQEFGDLYPNPAVVAAAVLARTRRIRVHAGSVVLPLHNPIRVLEDWSSLDSLSGGRVGISVGTGWNPADFVLAPKSFEDRREIAMEGLLLLRESWRSGVVTGRTPSGDEIALRVRPTRVQPSLPLALTTSGRPETWLAAGEYGLAVFASTIGQTRESLAGNIAAYRAAFASDEGGRPWVTVVVHTYIGPSRDVVRRAVAEPLKEYLETFLAQTPGSGSPGRPLTPAENRDLLDFAFERYWANMSMLGTPETCRATAEDLVAFGVDEIACLVDFGPSAAQLMTTVERLGELATALGGPTRA
jgi:natural product biosynthesis luciferase-like monooxygenase protein